MGKKTLPKTGKGSLSMQALAQFEIDRKAGKWDTTKQALNRARRKK